ncbi:MAG: DNA polymerase III subunit chi [Polaromonas sp.]|nr:DNA polymerase III subunit chi [Polaromonas sp.]
MTEIAFHFNVADKLMYGCRLLRKVYSTSARVLVTAEPELLDELDQLLWSFSPTDFVPHCRLGAGESGPGEAPVILTETLQSRAGYGILVNLGRAVPIEFERFERFIEVVAQGEGDRLAARSRWKHYADRGYAMKRHDLRTAGDSA